MATLTETVGYRSGTAVLSHYCFVPQYAESYCVPHCSFAPGWRG